MTRMTLYLSDREFVALQHMAGLDLRDLNKQVRWLVLQEAQTRGLLPDGPHTAVVDYSQENGERERVQQY